MTSKTAFDARYTVRPSGRGFGLWDRQEGRFTGRHGIERYRIEQRRAFMRQHCSED